MTKKVTDINKARRSNNPPDKKPPRTDLYFTICDSINQSKSSFAKHFNRKFIVVKTEDGTRKVMEADSDDVCKYVPDDVVIDAIINFCHTNPRLQNIDAYKFDVDQARKCFEFWKRSAPVTPTPATFLWKGEEGFCMTRMQFEYDPCGETPILDEIFSRMTENAEAARDFIGSIFVPGSYRQQYLYFYSPQGGDGKGTICSVLEKALGPAADQFTSPIGIRGGERPNWTARLPGCRLAIIDDLDDPSMVLSGIWNRVTGGDTVQVNQKFEREHTAHIDTKFIITSNYMPDMKSRNSARRRAIIVPMKSAKVEMARSEYAEKAHSEAGPFISKCIEQYLSKYPNNDEIKCTYCSFEDQAHEQNMPFINAFDTYFTENAESMCSLNEVFTKITIENSWDFKKYQAFKSWLTEDKGFQLKMAVGKNGKRSRHFIGFHNACNVP